MSEQTSDKLKSILFAAVLCLVCSVLLTAASTGLKPLQQKNILIDRKKNILKAVNLIEENKTYTENEITRLYDNKIKLLKVDESGKIAHESNEKDKTLPLYLYEKNKGEVEAYIIPTVAKGKVTESIPKEKQINHVDGISGATLTGKFFSKSMKDTLAAYEPVSIQFRDNRYLSAEK